VRRSSAAPLIEGLLSAFADSVSVLERLTNVFLRAIGYSIATALGASRATIESSGPGRRGGCVRSRRTHGFAELQIAMQVAYMDHMIEASEARGVDPTFPAYVKELMQRAIAAGHGSDDFGRLLDGFSMASPTRRRPDVELTPDA
jgi:hypothetical protein